MTKRWLAALFGLILIASACGNGGETQAGSDRAEEDGTEGDGAEEDGAEEDGGEFVYESPLGEFLGWTQQVDFNAEDAQAEAQEQERQVQELVAVCMRAEGFDYTPVDRSGQGAFFGGEVDDGEAWGSEAWTRKFGFGITTTRFSQAQVGPDLIGHNFPTGPGPEGEGGFVDPNQDYIDSLSESEQGAYYGALYGTNQGQVFGFEEEEREPTEEEMEEMERNYVATGCEPVAYEEVYTQGGEEQFQAFDDEFGDLLEEMFQRAEASPEIVEFRAEVQACVLDKGFEYLGMEEAYQFFEQKMEAAGLNGDPFSNIDFENLSDEEIDQAFQDAQNKPLPPDQLAALAEVQDEEIGMAVAAVECGGGARNEANVFNDLRVEMENQFLEDNKERLAQYEGVFSN